MAFDGSGNYTRTNGVNTGTTVWASDDAAGTAILSSRHDTHDQDIATALSNCYCKDGQSTPTANLPMGGYKFTTVGSASALDQYAAASQVQNSSFLWGGTSGGSANAHTISVSPTPSAYAAGQRFQFLSGNTNTSSVTLNVNSLGAKTIKQGPSNVNLVAGQLTASSLVDVVYDGTNFLLVSQPWVAAQTYTPSYSASGSMTFGTVTTSIARYHIRQRFCRLQLEFFGTTGGTASNSIIASLPITEAQGMTAMAYVVDGSGASAQGYVSISGGNASFFKPDASNFGLGAARACRITVEYEI